MKKITHVLFMFLMLQGFSLSSQDIDFNVRFNGTTNVYEVYAKPAFDDAFYFVGGGSQVSVLLPEFASDVALTVTSVNGGLWTDNSQVYAPTADPDHDFHGVATNGAPVTFVNGEELLLFTFTFPEACIPYVRLFDNGSDPDSSAPGMGGGDFEMFYASVFDPFNNNWNLNYENTNVLCPEAPVVISNPLTVLVDNPGTICLPITDLNVTDTFNVVLCTASPANGAATPTITGNTLCIDYTPDAGYTGTDDICLIVCDVSSLCDTVSVPVTVVPEAELIPANLPPVVIVTPITTPQDSSANICTVIMDHNVGDTFTANVCTGSPANGTAVATVSGNELCINYTPDTGYTGNDDICIIVCDQTSLCDTISIPTSVIPTLADSDSLQAPIVVMPPVVTLEDTTLTVCGTIIEANVSDIHTVTILEQPVNGTATAAVDDADNTLCVTVDPNPNFFGSDSLSVEVCDQGGLCYTTIVPIEVTPVNDPPLAINDINTTQMDNPVSGLVLTNDSDPEGENLTVNTIPMNVTNGTVTIDAAGNYTFTPDPGFTGDGSFEYEVCDDGYPVKCDTAIVVIEVMDNTDPDNNDVVGVPDNFIMEEGATLNANILSNDSDPDGDNLVINTTAVSGPSNGILTINADGSIVYTPTPGYSGTDEFTYEVCDDGTPQECDNVLVTIEILEDNFTNDVYATDDHSSAEIGQLQSGNVTDNDNDPEAGTLTVTLLDDVDNGSLMLNADGTFTYLPDPGFVGNDQFVYQVCDDGAPVACDSATVYITVLDSKDAPVVIPNPLTIPMDSTGNLCMPITDPNTGDTFTVSLCTDSPANGAATPTVTDGTLCVEYTPTVGYTGTDDICMIICDQTGRCDTASVPVTVVPELYPVPNPEPPTVIVTPITTPMDSTATVCTAILDPNIGDTFTATICPGWPINGTAVPTVDGNTLCIEYTPDPGYVGTDDICLTVCDQDALCQTVSIFTTVVPAPEPTDTLQAPILVMPPIVTPEDSTETVCGPVIDANVEDIHTISICAQPANGSATAAIDNDDNSVCVTFDPDPNFNGSDSLCLEVCDQGGLCYTTMVAIEVLPANDPPIAIDDINNTQVNIPTSGNVLTNDWDPEGHTLTVSTTPINPTNGTVTIDAAGNYTFTPTPGFVGTGTFQYEICEDGVPPLCDTATVVIGIIDVTNPVNNAVNGSPDNFVTEDDATLTGDLLSNDSDPDGDPLTINTTPVSGPASGALTINADGTFSYVPVLGVTETQYFTYEVCDDGAPALCADVLVTIEILATDGENSIYATDDSSVDNENVVQTGDVTLNDNDPENGVLTVSTTPLVGTTNGTLVLNADGTFTYTPNADFNGNDQFVYQVCDDGSPSACDSATVYITVLNVATEFRLKVMLHGALFGATDSLMRADLVPLNLVPLAQPYDTLAQPLFVARFTPVIGGDEVTTAPVLNANLGTADAIVDWVFIELRDATDSVTVIRTFSALVQRDGDIVNAADGGAIWIDGLPLDFFIVVKHRNHLGAMTAAAVDASFKLAVFDYTTAAAADLYDDGTVYDGLEQKEIFGLEALWAGNSNADVKTKYDGPLNDRLVINANVILDPGNTSNTLNFNNAIDYYLGDVNLDGKAKYDGFGNDRILMQSVVLTFPLNASYLNNYNLLIEQIR